MIDQSDFTQIDGEQYCSGRAMARMTIATVLGDPKGKHAKQFYRGVVPAVRKTDPETARAIELALAHYSADMFRFKIRRSLSVGGPFDPLQLLDESDRLWIDSLCERIDRAIGVDGLIRAMGFNPVGLDN